MVGRIVKGVGGLYSVEAGGGTYLCKARGKFRKLQQTPTVGDVVTFAPGGADDEGVLLSIHERRNCIARPPVANVDGIAIVLAAAMPEPDFSLCDRLIFLLLREGIRPLVVVNKVDLGHGAAQDARADYAPAGIAVLEAAAQEGAGIERLRAELSGVWGLAGQSGVGKSSLTNALIGTDIQTGGMSRIERGRHTTRHVELLPVPGGGYLADTPGFSLLDMPLIKPLTLQHGWPEFAPHAACCRFCGCAHIGEKGCAVQEAADGGVVSQRRLERYRALYSEAQTAWQNRYG